jgi:hypothetical protein
MKARPHVVAQGDAIAKSRSASIYISVRRSQWGTVTIEQPLRIYDRTRGYRPTAHPREANGGRRGTPPSSEGFARQLHGRRQKRRITGRFQLFASKKRAGDGVTDDEPVPADK